MEDVSDKVHEFIEKANEVVGKPFPGSCPFCGGDVDELAQMNLTQKFVCDNCNMLFHVWGRLEDNPPRIENKLIRRIEKMVSLHYKEKEWSGIFVEIRDGIPNSGLFQQHVIWNCNGD